MRGLFDTPELGPCTVELFPHQQRAVERARDEYRRGIKRTLIVHATGTGKMIIAAMVGRWAIERGRELGKPNRVLFLAHTDELIQQAADKFDLVGVEPGIEQAGSFARMMFDPELVVGSVMTMKEDGRLKSFPEDWFGLIIVDEAHHASSFSYKKIMSRFPNARVLGLTATPKRGDDVSLGGIFESVADTFSILDAWDAEKETGVQYLCDLVPVRLDVDIDLRKLKPQKGDFTDQDLDARIAPMIDLICNKTAEKIGERQTVAFFPSIRSAQFFAKGMQDLGFKADAVWGADPKRDEKVEAYRRGEVQVLANMDLLREGFDVPNTSAVVLARPTKSWTLFLQQIGRGTRRGKKDCYLIDLNFLTDEFGLVQPTDLVDVPGFDQEIAKIAAEMIQQTPGLSLRTAIENARDEHQVRLRRKQMAIRLSIAERQIACEEETFSMKELHHDGVAFTGTVQGPTADFKLATPGQIRFLKALGIENCERWSRGRAGTVISYMKRQREAGKSRPQQRAKLIRAGVDAADAREMSVDQANAALDQYARRREQVYGGQR